MKPEYLRPGFNFALAHAVEEAGEFLAAAGKTQRWGLFSVNPELPPEEQETNARWMKRELRDLRGAIRRLLDAVAEEERKEAEAQKLRASIRARSERRMEHRAQ